MDKQPNAGDTNQTGKAGPKAKVESPRRSSGVSWVVLGGVALIAGGAALTVLPRVARDLGWITNNFAKNGIYGAQLALTGAVVCAVGFATRKRVDQDDARARAEKDLLLEQVASDLALARGTMQDLRVEFVYLKDAVQTAAAQREMLDKNGGEDATQSAIFRLAASIDQLGGQTDQRAKAQEAALQEKLSQLRTDIAVTNTCVSELRDRLEAAMQDSGGSAQAEATYRLDDERQIEIAEGYAPSDDDLHVVVDMEEPSSTGLGLLDEFDDLGSHVSTRGTNSIRPSIPSSNGSAELTDVRGPLPSRKAGSEPSVEEKLAALRSLMADPNVRRALESARNAV